MRFLTALVSVLPLAAAASINRRQYDCYSGVYIIVAPPKANATPGLQQSLIDSVTSSIEGSGTYVVPYDSYNSDYPSAIQSGVDLMSAEIADYADRCPGSPMVLMGYSLGGIVMMNTICGGISTDYTSSIIGAIGYGEETFVPGQSYSEGTCTVGPSRNPREDPSTCDAYGASIQNYCDAGDTECCSGDDPDAHFAYANNYDDDATSFIVDRYNSQ